MEIEKIKILRITTVPASLKILLKGQHSFLSENNFDVYCVSSSGKEVKDIYETEKIKEHFAINLTRKISPFNDLIAIWQCYKIIKKINPKIVHTYTPKAGLVGMIAAYIAGIKIRIHNVTGLPLMEKRGVLKIILILIEKVVYSFSSHIFVNSKELEKYIKKNISKNVQVLGYGSTNGVNIDYFKKNDEIEIQSKILRKKYGLTEKGFIWIYIGRLVKDKGIIELINAFQKFNIANTSSKLLLIGEFEPDLDPLPVNIIEIINTNKLIIATGFQNDVRPFLNISNCLLFPSYREGLPNVPMQAACFDLPCVVTDINGCNEIIIHEINGLLVKPKDEFGLLKAMEKIFLDKKLREKMGSQARLIVLEKFNQTKVWNLLLQEYVKIIG